MWARSRNSVSAGPTPVPASSGASEPSGSGPRVITVSPSTPSDSRLVTSSRTCRPGSVSSSATSATWSRICSQLSSTRSTRRSVPYAVSTDSGVEVSGIAILTAATISAATSAVDSTTLRSTNQIPSGYVAAADRAAAVPSSVLPLPAPPTMVTRAELPRAAASRSSSSARPTTGRARGRWISTSRGGLGGGCTAEGRRAGSWSRICRWSSTSSAPGSMPTSSIKVRRAVRKVARASSLRPARCSASIRSHHNRSRYG